jgi:outer membrane receptor protein involved in Fe transport
MAAFTAQRVYLRADTLGFGAIPQDEAGWALNAGILNATDGRDAPRNPDGVFAGLPEVAAHLYAALELPGGLRISGGPAWRDGHYHDMQRAMRIPGHTLWNAQLSYDTGDYWIRLHVDNLLDRAYWIGQEPVFSAGTLILQGPGRSFHLAAGIRF